MIMHVTCWSGGLQPVMDNLRDDGFCRKISKLQMLTQTSVRDLHNFTQPKQAIREIRYRKFSNLQSKKSRDIR